MSLLLKAKLGAGVARGRGALLVLLGSCLLLLVGCPPRLLGIEEREADAEEYPTDGYLGCVPGDCGRCLFETHRLRCQGEGGGGMGGGGTGGGGTGGGGTGGGQSVPPLGLCQDRVSLDPCTSCACGGCQTALEECNAQDDCGRIWSCLSTTGCQGVAQPGIGCLAADACAAAIASSGGSKGAALSEALRVRSCAADQGCSACEPHPPEPCSPVVECGGDAQSDCPAECAPPSVDCSPAEEPCVGLGKCSSGAQAGCDAGCAPQCPLPVDCEALESCQERCQCRGQSATECAKECPQSCIKAAGGAAGECGGCDSCLARCTCQGTSAVECAEQCNFSLCLDSGDCACGACLCNAPARAPCLGPRVDCEASECSGCACSSCVVELLLCAQSSGCLEAFECLQCAEGDAGACDPAKCPALQTPAHPSDAGPELNSPVSAFEALVACTAAAECNCRSGP